ncbi:tRNA (adenosine(37)-N6)-threonylcarbamoyltransferase complex ATPase subunit type 1 TsaE [Pseudanabaena biceps]|nr:tRNA (adenosine(37)-N6)-threonylcarbamoyltransferase complex ATPase subunit type 1 TsaE [Pseudanabaena biceps]
MTEPVKIHLYAKNLSVTQEIATQLAQIVTAGTIILLEGDLGSGKTTFMQAFGRALGINTTICSPTFTLIDEYIDGRLPLYHIDLYRLEPSQVPSLHLEEYGRDGDFPLGVVAIEWASKMPHLPESYLKINFSISEVLPIETEDKSSSLNESLQIADESLDDFLEELPEGRDIQITAHGDFYCEMLQHFAINYSNF